MSNTSYRTRALTILALFLVPAAACASIVVPAGLSPGDNYHLAFVTSGQRDATSSNIDDYNDFVNDQAGLSGAITKDWGIDWFAIGSTASVDARDNAVVSAPVYLLDGTTQIATGYADMWEGALLHEIDTDQLDANVSAVGIWTGTDEVGRGAAGAPLGSVTAFSTLGLSGYPPTQWLSYFTGMNKLVNFQLYALSEPLTAPPANPIPEPTSLLVWAGLATAGVWVTRRRRRKP
ncbi:MAG: PEP-CTERM sorting domain-containing protein [Pirellulales bacterium]